MTTAEKVEEDEREVGSTEVHTVQGGEQYGDSQRLSGASKETKERARTE